MRVSSRRGRVGIRPGEAALAIEFDQRLLPREARLDRLELAVGRGRGRRVGVSNVCEKK